MGLEGIADGEVEGGVALPVGVDERPWNLSLGRVVGFHAQVESQKKIVEVKAQSKTIGGRNLLIEFIELEHSSRLVGIVADGPDVAGVDKCTEFEYPE